MSLREGLERLELSEGGQQRNGELSTLSRDLRARLAELQRTSADLDSSWRMQVIRENSSKRDVWKRKVEQVSEEVDSIKASLEKFSRREFRRNAEQADREELLQRATAGRVAKQAMDEEAQVQGSVARSKRALDEIYESGTNILTSMAGSRERLKSAHKKVLDVLNSVGLGESLLRVIERRQRMDIWITYGGMVLVLLLVVLMMWWAWS